MNGEVQAWLEKADEDWKSAEWLLQEESPVVTPSLFHLQQAAEKWLKAYLVSRGIAFERRHDLLYLLELTASPSLSPHVATLAELTPFAVEFRYPGDLPQFSRGEGLALMNRVRSFREAILPQID